MDVIFALFTYYSFELNELQFFKAKEGKGSFNVEDVKTCSSVTAGQLAYNIISGLISDEKIESEELEKHRT